MLDPVTKVRHRRRVSAASLFATTLAAHASATVIHVRSDAGPGGDGQSWVTAYRDLRDALAQAAGTAAAESIWVAAGEYRPDAGTGSRIMSFELSAGVSVLGGFAGDETSADQRDPAANPTILTGDLLGDDGVGFAGNTENSFHVVTALGLDTPAVLDGCVVRGGNANGFVSFLRGGGIFSIASEVALHGCRVEDNSARLGGGLHAVASSITVVGCEFVGNHATERGGAVDSQESTLISVQTAFEANASDISGGAIRAVGGSVACAGGLFHGNQYVTTGGGIAAQGSIVVLDDVDFLENVRVGTATSVGGAIHTVGGELAAFGCRFEDHVGAYLGGAVSAENPTTFIACEFRRNEVTSRGAAIDIFQAHPLVVSGCVFELNTAGAGGGAIYTGGGLFQASGCSFVENRAIGGQGPDGGAVRLSGSATIVACDFVGNSASRVGGAIAGVVSMVAISGCNFLTNGAERGGAISFEDVEFNPTEIVIADCWFDGNAATIETGAIHLTDLDGAVRECTFDSNSAASGGALLVTRGSIAVAECSFASNAAAPAVRLDDGLHGVFNSILRGNGGGVVVAANAQATIVNCLVAGNTGAGVRIEGGADATVASCTIVSNNAASGADGVAATGTGSTGLVHNTVLWSNGGTLQQNQVGASSGATLVFDHCTVHGWTGTLGGRGNVATDPLFVSLLGPDGLAGTGDEDLHLLPVSTAIDSGDSRLLPSDAADLDGDGDTLESVPWDLDGSWRVVGGLDRGAYETTAAGADAPIRTTRTPSISLTPRGLRPTLWP